ncbi:MAG: DUF3488 and DUF4129 domain-containing transglutaminase family protein [Phycisphaeraceae bacterium]
MTPLLARFRRLVFVQVLVGIVAFCIAERNPGLLLIAGGLAGLGWYVSEEILGRALPRWLVNLGVVAALAWLAVDIAWHRGSLVLAVGHFTLWLQLLILLMRKGLREYAQLMVLSALQMVAASILSVSMLYALLLAVYCVLAMISVMMMQLAATGQRVAAANHRALGTTPRDATAPAVTRGYRMHFRLATLGVGAVTAAVAVVAFLVMPRSGSARGSTLAGEAASQRRVGFSDQVRLGQPLGSPATRDVVLNFEILDDGGEPVEPGRPWLLRGAVLDRYNPARQSWKRSRSVSATSLSCPLTDTGRRLIDLPAGTPTRSARITLRQHGSEILFTVFPPTWIGTPDAERFYFSPLDQRVTVSRSDRSAGLVYEVEWPLDPPSQLRDRYEQTLTPRETAATGLWQGPGESYARRWPVQTRRVARLAREVLAEKGLSRDPDAPPAAADREIAAALADYLRTQCSYSLEPQPLPEQTDPVIDFLFQTRTGHCELFAAGLAALARSINLPARLVTGYLASEYNRVGGYYVVREENAHAWTEIYCGPELGWQVFDATAVSDPDPAVAASESGRFSSIRDFYDHAEYLWVRDVVGFDVRNQGYLAAAIDATWRRAVAGVKRLDDWIRRPESWQLGTASAAVAGGIVAAIGLALVLLARLLMARRKKLTALQLHKLPRSRRRGLVRQLRFYLVMLEMLERHGYDRPGWQSPYHFAQELADANPMRFDPVVALTEIFYEIRFGNQNLDPSRRQRVQAHLKQLEHALINPRG